MRKVTVAAIQMACSPDAAENRRTAEAMVRQAAGNGAQIILLPELFESPYFCQERRYASYELATTPAENPAIAQLRKVAAELQVVLRVSFYEKAGTALYNSIAIIDADGSVLGIYRKTHIPDDHFYQEKFYFTPGDTGFKVWNTRYARIGVPLSELCPRRRVPVLQPVPGLLSPMQLSLHIFQLQFSSALLLFLHTVRLLPGI